MIEACPSCGTRNRLAPSRLAATAHCGRCKSALPPLDAPVHIASASEFDALVRGSALPVIVDFWAEWCGPCRSVAPELEKLARSRAGKVVVAKVDTQALPGVAERFAIRGIPAFVLFKDGKESGRTVGAMPAEQLARSLGV